MTQFRKDIERIMLCPDDWDKIFPRICDVEHTWHKLDWLYCLEAVSFGGVETIVIRASAANDESVYDRVGIDWREVRDNLDYRRSEAVNLYNTRAHKLSNIRYYSPSYNNKHYIPGDEEKIIKQSLRNRDASLFLEDYSPEQIRNGFSIWLTYYFHNASLAPEPSLSTPFEDYVLSNDPNEILYQNPRAKLWRKILNEHSIRFAFEATYKIGYRSGVPLTHICFDLEMSSNSLHAYPISKEEADAFMGGPEEVVINKPAWW